MGKLFSRKQIFRSVLLPILTQGQTLDVTEQQEQLLLCKILSSSIGHFCLCYKTYILL